MTRPNEQRQLDLFYVPHNIFEGNTCKYILTGADVALRYMVARAFKTKWNLHLCCKKYIRSVVCLITQRYLIVIIGLSLKVMWQRCWQKHDVDIRRATVKHKHKCAYVLLLHLKFVAQLFWKPLTKDLSIQSFRPMDAQELQEPERVSAIWVEDLNSIVNKMNHTKPKDAI